MYLLVLTVAFAVSSWLSGSEQQVIAATFPAWSQAAWYGGLTARALLALAGIAFSEGPGYRVGARRPCRDRVVVDGGIKRTHTVKVD